MKTRYLNSKPYRRIMYQYFSYHEWDYLFTITKAVVINRNGVVVVKVESHRPGLLIGKQGRFIDGLEKRLSEETGRYIKIEVTECKVWNNLYS